MILPQPNSISATLLDIIRNISAYQPDWTIYAKKPWSETSAALVLPESDFKTIPSEAAEKGMEYFLEISVANDFLDDLKTYEAGKSTIYGACARLIQYAVSDA